MNQEFDFRDAVQSGGIGEEILRAQWAENFASVTNSNGKIELRRESEQRRRPKNEKRPSHPHNLFSCFVFQIGEILKEKFDNAHEVQQRKRRGRRMLLDRRQDFKPHTDTDLVYLKKSPDYCEYDPDKGSLGTKGRECNPVS